MKKLLSTVKNLKNNKIKLPFKAVISLVGLVASLVSFKRAKDKRDKKWLILSSIFVISDAVSLVKTIDNTFKPEEVLEVTPEDLKDDEDEY